MSKDDRVSRALQDQLQREMERAILGDAMTSTVTQPETTLDANKFIAEMDKVVRNFRRTQVVFIVDRAHQGPPIKHQTPNDGERIELSWAAANTVHQQWPLKLSKILSEDAAEFVPVSAGFGEWVPKILPCPPFEVPPEESFEDWKNGITYEQSS